MHLYKYIIEQSAGNLYWKDLDGKYLGCNKNFHTLCGFSSPEELIGKNDYELFSHMLGNGIDVKNLIDLEQIREGDKQACAGMTILCEETGLNSKLEPAIYLSTKSPLIDENNKIVGVIGTSLDITELKNTQNELIKAKEEAEAASKAKTEFVQNMQHDIRTPSAGLWGVLDILAKAENDPTKKETLEMAVAASKRLLDLCNDAVEFGDLSGNNRPQLEKPFDIRELARSIIELNKPAAFSKDLSMYLHVDSKVPAHIVSDEFRISRILINLLGNAVKFSHKGEVSLIITVDIKEENQRKGILNIEVKDQGIGIPKDKIDYVFEKFTRGVESNTNKYPGTGLGLYVVKTFVDELDGDIWAESHEDEGAYFKLIIPFKVLWDDMGKQELEIDEHFTSPFKETKEAVKTIKSIPEVEKAAPEKAPFSHELLIIEDDKMCLHAEKNLLLGFTNKIDSAESMAEALKKLASKRYDLVISDLGLPDGSGNDIVAKIKSSPDSPNYETPFVAMTAHRNPEKHQQAMEAGFTAINTKPLNTEKAVELLKSYHAKGNEPEKEGEGNEVIDLALGMQRIAAKAEKDAIEALSLLYKTMTEEDIPALKEAQKNNDIAGAREVLHKIRGGLCYSGTPRLEEAVKLLHAEVKRTPELNKINEFFTLVYYETNLFIEEYKELTDNK